MTSVWVSRPGAVSVSVWGVEDEDVTGRDNDSEPKTTPRPNTIFRFGVA
jgi:hypothetical protein